MIRSNGRAGLQFALQTHSHGTGIGGRNFRLFAIALITPAPVYVARRGEGRTKSPVDAGDRRLLGGGLADPPDKVRIARRPQADIVRKERCAPYLVVTVHRINAHQQGNGLVTGVQPRRGGVKSANEVQPIRGGTAIVALGRVIAPGQDRTHGIPGQIFGPKGSQVRLDSLPDLLLKGHGRHQRIDPPFGLRIGQGGRTMGLWPEVGVGDRFSRNCECRRSRRQGGRGEEAHQKGAERAGSWR